MAALTLNTGYEEIVRILDDGTKRLLHMEHPEMIQALCRGLAALPESWNNPSQVMYKLIRTAQKVQRYDNYMYVQQWVPIIPMVLILCCSGLNVGVLCVREALERYRKMVNSDIKVHIIEVICYEIDSKAQNIGFHVLQDLPKPVRIVMGCDVKFAPSDAVHLSDYPHVVKIVAALSTECNAVSFASSKVFPPGTSGLHTHPSDTFHPAYKMVKTIQDIRDVENIAVVAELPLCKHDQDNKELTDKMGAAVLVKARDYGDADRNRYLRTSPMITEAKI